MNTASSISLSQVKATAFFSNGKMGINTTTPTTELDINGSARIITGITTGILNATSATISDIQNTNISTGVLIASTGLTVGNINFTGSLYNNGVAYLGSSQWTTTAGNISYTNGSILATDAVFTNVTYANAILTNATINNFSFGTNVTVNNLLATNLNLGVSSMYSGSFVASNNVTSATNVTGFSFSNANIRSFNASVSVSVVLSVGTSLYGMVNLNGTQNASGWSLYTETLGDETGVTFTITNAGQIQYTSANQSNWTSTTFRFNAQQFSATGTYSSLSANTQGSYIMDSIQLNNTTDAVSGISNGPLYVLGGATIKKNLNADGGINTDLILSTNIVNTGLFISTNSLNTQITTGELIANTGITSANARISNANITISTIGTLNIPTSLLAYGGSNTLGSLYTTGGNIGIGITNPSGLLHLNNVALFASTGNLTCTGDILAFGNLSDRRLKKNIQSVDTETAIDIVSKLRSVTFDWNDNIFNELKRNTSDIGFIAQEVEELVPLAVSEYKEITSGEVYKNIKHERLIPYLLTAIQYLLKKHDVVEN